jgi:hypothetical protein
MEKDKKFQDAIARLTETTEKWNRIKNILLEEIKAHQDIINYIDKHLSEKENKFSKLN